MIRKVFIPSLILISFSLLPAEELVISGLLQEWFSFAQSETGGNRGFSLRRARLKISGSPLENLKWAIQYVYDQQKPRLLDAHLSLRLSSWLNIKAGQFKIPASYGGLTSSSNLDFIERAMVVQKWSGFNDLVCYRNLGVQISGVLLDHRVGYAIMAANPRAEVLFTPRIRDTDYGDHRGLQVTGQIRIHPVKSLELGGFYLCDHFREHARHYRSSGFFASLVQEKLFLKAEYLRGRRTPDSANPLEISYLGYLLSFGIRLGKFQPVIRYDSYREKDPPGDTNERQHANLTLGINCFILKRIKLQANYVFRPEELAADIPKPAHDIFYFNLQYTFSTLVKEDR